VNDEYKLRSMKVPQDPSEAKLCGYRWRMDKEFHLTPSKIGKPCASEISHLENESFSEGLRGMTDRSFNRCR
jgi:hypothetical protein